MKYLKYYFLIHFLTFLQLTVLFGQNNTDTVPVKFYSKNEIVDRNCYYENTDFLFRLKAVDYSSDSVKIIAYFRNKSKKQCFLNKNILEGYRKGDSLVSLNNFPMIPNIHSDREIYILELLDSNEEFNSEIRFEKKNIKKIDLRLVFSYSIDEILAKYPNQVIDTKKKIVLQGYLGSYDEGIGMQEITIGNFYVNESGETSILFIGIN
jgi:hypothetical protein